MKETTSTKIPQDFIDLIDDQFLEAAKKLRAIYDANPAEFASAAKQMKISLRKAYYLADIDRTFRNSGISERRLRRLGWTKLALLGPYIGTDKANADHLVALAETFTAHQLKQFLCHMEVDPHGRTIVLHLNAKQHAIFEQAAILGGAAKKGKTLANKETGLINFLSSHLPK